MRFFGRARHIAGQRRCVHAIYEEVKSSPNLQVDSDLKRSIDITLGVLIRHAKETDDVEELMRLHEIGKLFGTDYTNHQQVGTRG